jgi:hypothetical protein
MIMLSNSRMLKPGDSAFLRIDLRRLNSFVRRAASGVAFTRAMSRSSISRTAPTFLVNTRLGSRIQQKLKSRRSDKSPSIELLTLRILLKSALAVRSKSLSNCVHSRRPARRSMQLRHSADSDPRRHSRRTTSICRFDDSGRSLRTLSRRALPYERASHRRVSYQWLPADLRRHRSRSC